MRILAIDLGTRRVGLAISDPEERFAFPLEIVQRQSDGDLLDRLCSIAAREEAEMLLVGEPRRLDGATNPAVERARDFAARLAAQSGLTVETIDEALTSNEAARRQSEAPAVNRSKAGRARRAPKARRSQLDALDAIAAQVFLEDFLTQRGSPR